MFRNEGKQYLYETKICPDIHTLTSIYSQTIRYTSTTEKKSSAYKAVQTSTVLVRQPYTQLF